MKKITIIVGVVSMMSSCGIQFGNYDRWKEVHRNNTCSVKEITDELIYYIQEDSFNGGLDSTVIQLYIDKINEIKKECCIKTAQEVYEYEGWTLNDCENCDEID